jgi:hypothetical protein
LDVRNPVEFALGVIGLIDAGAVSPYLPAVVMGSELAASCVANTGNAVS